jgi:hypothetical protein
MDRRSFLGVAAAALVPVSAAPVVLQGSQLGGLNGALASGFNMFPVQRRFFHEASMHAHLPRTRRKVAVREVVNSQIASYLENCWPR